MFSIHSSIYVRDREHTEAELWSSKEASLPSPALLCLALAATPFLWTTTPVNW